MRLLFEIKVEEENILSALRIPHAMEKEIIFFLRFERDNMLLSQPFTHQGLHVFWCMRGRDKFGIGHLQADLGQHAFERCLKARFFLFSWSTASWVKACTES